MRGMRDLVAPVGAFALLAGGAALAGSGSTGPVVVEDRTEAAARPQDEADDQVDDTDEADTPRGERSSRAFERKVRLLGDGDGALPPQASPRARAALHRSCLRLAQRTGGDPARCGPAPEDGAAGGRAGAAGGEGRPDGVPRGSGPEGGRHGPDADGERRGWDRAAGRMAGRVRRRTRRAVSGRSSGASGAAAMCLEPPHAPLRDRSRSPDRVRRDRRDGPPCRPAGACSPRGCDAMVRPRPRRAVNGPGPAASQRLPTRVHPTVQQRPRSPDTDHRRGMVAGQPGVPSRSVSSCGPRRRWSSGPTASTVRSSSTAPMKPGEVGSSIVPPSAA